MADVNYPKPIPLNDLTLAQYESYLPTAFDESLTLVQKYNKLLWRVSALEKLVNEIIEFLKNGTLPTPNPDPDPDPNPDPEPTPEKTYLIDGTVNVDVGNDGLFTTIQAALNFFSDKFPNYRGKVNLNLQNGFIMKEQVLVENIDLGFISINGSSATHVIDVGFLTKTYNINQSPEFSVTPAFTTLNGKSPRLNAFFKMSTKTIENDTITGVYLNNSNMEIAPNKGIIDSNFIGLCAISGSNVNAPYCNFSNSGNREDVTPSNYDTMKYGDCFRIWASTLTAPYSNGDSAGDIGYNINMGSTANINYAHSNNTTHHGIMSSTASKVSARNAVCNNVIDDAVVAYAGSSIDFRYGECNNTLKGSGIVATRSSQINFEGGRASNCYNGGIYVNRGSSVDADGAIVTDCTKDNVTCANGSMLNFNNATSTGSKQDNLHCNHGYNVTAFNTNLSNAGECGILAYGAGTISAENAVITNAKIRNVEVSSGGVVNMRGAQTGGSLGGSDLSVYYGGVINAYNATGTLNRTVNTLTSDGIIYKK